MPVFFETVQRYVLVAGVVFAVFGISASTGCTPIPKGPRDAAYFLHPLVIGAGLAGGLLTLKRREEIDRQRFEVSEDENVTRFEREHAHREAESEIRWAGTVFCVTPLALGYWLAYQFNDPEQLSVADFLTVSPLLGFLLGLAVGSRLMPTKGPPASG